MNEVKTGNAGGQLFWLLGRDIGDARDDGLTNKECGRFVEMVIDAACDKMRAEIRAAAERTFPLVTLADDPVVRKVEAAFAMPPSNGAAATVTIDKGALRIDMEKTRDAYTSSPTVVFGEGRMPPREGTVDRMRWEAAKATAELRERVQAAERRVATAEAELADLRSCPPPSKGGAWEAWEAALKEFEATPFVPAPKPAVDLVAELELIMSGMVAWPQLPSVPRGEIISLAFQRLGELKARLIAGQRHPEPGPTGPPSNGKPACTFVVETDDERRKRRATIFDHVSGVRVPVAPVHVPTEPEPAEETPTAIETDAAEAARDWLASPRAGRYPDYTERDPWEGGQPWRGRNGALPPSRGEARNGDLPYRVERPIGFRTKPN